MYKYINNYKCMPPVSMSNQHKTEKKNIVHLCNYYMMVSLETMSNYIM